MEDYTRAISAHGAAIEKGHLQTDEDLLAKKIILQVACQGRISQRNFHGIAKPSVIGTVNTFCAEGILQRDNADYVVTETGRAFIRNICSAFDLRRNATVEKENIFSKAI